MKKMCAKKERFYETIFGIRRKTESDVQKSQFQNFLVEPFTP